MKKFRPPTAGAKRPARKGQFNRTHSHGKLRPKFAKPPGAKVKKPPMQTAKRRTRKVAGGGISR